MEKLSISLSLYKKYLCSRLRLELENILVARGKCTFQSLEFIIPDSVGRNYDEEEDKSLHGEDWIVTTNRVSSLPGQNINKLTPSSTEFNPSHSPPTLPVFIKTEQYGDI